MKTLANNKNTPSVSVIISSSDGYRDCWDPFFKLFQLYFPVELASEILLVTNAEEYSDPELNIRTITTNNKNEKILPWGRRMSIALEQANSDVVMILFEDLFLRSAVNRQKLKELIHLIYQHPEIGHIRLRTGPWRKEKSKFKDLDLIKRWTKYRVVMFPGLWRKEVLKKHLVLSELPWELEILGTWRSGALNDLFYSVSKDYLIKHGQIYNCTPAGGLIKGKWDERAVSDLFEKHQINVDYSLRGFYTPAERKKGRRELRRKVLSNIPDILNTILFIGVHLFFFQKRKKEKDI
ncbi:MAG: hypothetical protein IEMM0006_1611 [bacterium]|nr:MAG: hypothetical protein IEMM0006_1611 [bacterium]